MKNNLLTSLVQENSPHIQFMQHITDAAPGLIIVYNIKTGKYIYVNSTVKKILGYSKNDFLIGGLPFAASLIHPDDIKKLLEENNKALEKANNPHFAKRIDQSIINFEYRMRHKKGTYRWLHTDGIVFDRSVDGKVEHVMNISIDITDRKKSEEELAKKNKEITQANKKLQEADSELKKTTKALEKKVRERTREIVFREKRFRALIENNAEAIATVSADGKFTYVSPSVKKILGFTPKELIGRSTKEFFPPDYRDTALEKFSKVGKTPGFAASIEHKYFHKDRSIRWVESTITNLLQDPNIKAYVSNFRDITKRKQAEERSAFLGHITKKLITSLNHQLTLQEIASLLVPFLADYCRVVVVDENKEIKEIVVNHTDPKKVHLTNDLYTNYINDPNTTHGVGNILRKGQSEIISVVDKTVLETIRKNKKLLKIVRTIGLRSYMGVPLIVRNKIIGALTFSSVQMGRHYTKEDLRFAEEIAQRIALTLDNGRLYQEAVREIENRKKIEERYRILVEQASDGIFITDSEGKYLDVNTSGVKLFGYSREELLKKQIKDIVFEEDIRILLPDLEKLRAGKTTLSQWKIQRKDKRIISVEISAKMLPNRQFLGIVRDISERKALEERKDLFMSMASHELKTPLTSTKLFIEILYKHLKRQNDGKAMQFLRKIRDQMDKLQDLVNDLLDVSRIQTGKLHLKKETFDISELVKDSIEQLQLIAVRHEIVIQKSESQKILADRFRIYQVLTNLITNAMKYSPYGKKIIVCVTKNHENAIVSIQDFGIGVAKDQQDKIFERLYQVTDPTEKTFPGLGIGLYISKEIVTRHDGSIWLQSEKGKGSTFFFSLPLVNKNQET